MTGIKTETGIWLDISPDTQFELTIENPILNDDRIPVSWTTDIILLPTMLNKRVLGYIGALMTEPTTKKLKATIVAGGLGLFDGTLEYDSIDEDGNLIYTFSARDLNDDWSVKIYELQGFQYDQDSGYTYDSLMSALKDGEIDGIHLPLIINESMVAEQACLSQIDRGERASGTSSSGRRPLADYDWGNRNMKFRNSPGATNHSFTVPAVEIMRLLEHAIGKSGAGDLSIELSKLVIFATWWTTFQSRSSAIEYAYDISNALPDTSLRDLVKAICSMFCAAVFSDRDGFQIHTYERILTSTDVADWSDKVGDVFTSEREAAQSYELSYGSSEENEDSGILEKDTTANNLEEVINNDSDEYVAIEHINSGEIYSARSVGIHVYVAPTKDRPDSGYYEDIQEILCDRITEPGPATSGVEEESCMSVSIGLRLVRCVPIRHYWYDFSNSFGGGIQNIEHMAALMSLPSVESERPSDVYVAVLHDGQSSDRGIVIGKDGDDSAGLDITPGALFETYHKSFAEWIGKDRQRISVDLNISVYEAANFRMWRKVYILGRYFLIEKLSIRFNAGSDDSEISADLIAL